MAKLLMIPGLGAIESLVSGKQGALFGMLKEFHHHWDRIDIVSPWISDARAFQFFGNVFVHVSPYPLLFHPIYFVLKIIALHRKVHFDGMVVHEFPPFYNGIGARVVWYMTHIPYVLEVMHIPGHPRAAGIKEHLYRILMKSFIRFDAAKAKAVRVINRNEAPGFLERAGVPAGKIRYIPAFYIDLDVFHPEEAHKEYDLVYAARLEKNKGIVELLKAVKLLITNYQLPIKILIIGSGPLRGELDKFINVNHLKDNVFFSGWLPTADDVAKAYNSARIFVNPSYNEGGPRVVLEAMACGLPVITTRVGAMHDIIIDGENGLFTDWEPERMARVIVRLLRDAPLQEKFSHSGPLIAKRFERRAAIATYANGLKHIAGI